MADDQDVLPLVCHRCGAAKATDEQTYYVVNIEAFADPTPPHITGEQSATDLRSEIDRLIEQARQMSPQELMDQVYRRLTIYLCGPCYRKWIEHPTG